MSLLEKDRSLIWHPFTQEKTAAPPILITKGKDSYLYDDKNNKYLDLVSSWWVNIHGHANDEISNAIYNQCRKLEHVIFAGFTHEPAVTLCDSLTSLLPSPLRKFFFSDNGSTAVEVAMKMSYQWWKNQGYHKPLFVAFDGGYHGDTWGVMSVSVKSGFHDAFEKVVFPVLYAPFPDTWLEDDKVDEKEANSLIVLRQHLETNRHNISAIVLEPLVQGASGMRMCRASFIDKVTTLVREFDILVIFDEVMTGFGRTGTYFALDQTNAVPDFICLSKGITGGFLPLSLTVTTQKIYDSFLNDNFDKAFAHGHSYTGNPVTCAAAVASFKILTDLKTKNNIASINTIHRNRINELKKNCKNVQHARITGTIAAFDVKENVQVKKFKEKCFEDGILIRPLNRSVYLLPPYCITADELNYAYDVIIKCLNEF
uniref:Adenosylmethionine-8-amino-7-oxononanoate transaminase n=1 Tax=Planococcus citri TaxID=170843 RepID=S5NZR8_9HEMI|nr:adenosylmethionine-8-amino-7-oxononanoate transaminase [Planococcus citri]